MKDRDDPAADAKDRVLARDGGHNTITGQLNRAVAVLVQRGLIDMTIPDKPQRRLQKYRLTAAGRAAVAAAPKSSPTED